MTRDEHMAWCKTRALEYIERGDVNGAFASMASDLNKHEGTACHPGMQLGNRLLVSGHLASAQQMRDFIDGFA